MCRDHSLIHLKPQLTESMKGGFVRDGYRILTCEMHIFIFE
jgi:hypothetical protein